MTDQEVSGSAETNEALALEKREPKKGEDALHVVSGVSAILSILVFLKDSAEVAAFMLHHPAISISVLVVLLLLFSGDLIPSAAPGSSRTVSIWVQKLGAFLRGLWIWLLKRISAIGRAMGKGIFSYGRVSVVSVALLLVLFATYRVYVSGVYYVLLESSRDSQALSIQAAELNSKLIAGGSELSVEVSAPLGRSEYHSITMGPIFDPSEADEDFKELQRVLGTEIREDAGVRKVTFKNLWRKAVGFFE